MNRFGWSCLIIFLVSVATLSWGIVQLRHMPDRDLIGPEIIGVVKGSGFETVRLKTGGGVIQVTRFTHPDEQVEYVVSLEGAK